MPSHEYEFGMLYSPTLIAKAIKRLGAVDYEPLYLIPKCMKKKEVSELDFRKSIPPVTWRTPDP